MGEDLNQMHQKDSVLIRKPSKPLLKEGWPLYIFKISTLKNLHPSIYPRNKYFRRIYSMLCTVCCCDIKLSLYMSWPSGRSSQRWREKSLQKQLESSDIHVVIEVEATCYGQLRGSQELLEEVTCKLGG